MQERQVLMSLINRRGVVLLIGVLIVVALAGCSGSDAEGSANIELAPVSQMPPEVQEAEPKVREAYQFAVANQEYLANFPCYCGCGAMDHESNLDCYIDEVKDDGSIAFDNHAFQ